MKEEIVQNLNRVVAWWEIFHKRPAPKIYVSSLYPKDFGNIDEFGPIAREKLRGMWDSRRKAVILLANIQTLDPRILVSLLFHELGHYLRGHVTEPREDRPQLSMKEEKEAARVAVIDYVAYFGKGVVMPQDPRLPDKFYYSLGLRKVERKHDERTK